MTRYAMQIGSSEDSRRRIKVEISLRISHTAAAAHLSLLEIRPTSTTFTHCVPKSNRIAIPRETGHDLTKNEMAKGQLPSSKGLEPSTFGDQHSLTENQRATIAPTTLESNRTLIQYRIYSIQFTYEGVRISTDHDDMISRAYLVPQAQEFSQPHSFQHECTCVLLLSSMT